MIPNIDIKLETARLNRAIAAYAVLSEKTVEESTRKHAREFAFFLFRRLRALRPVKGQNQIRQSRLSALKSGQGIKIGRLVRQRAGSVVGLATDVRLKRLGFANKKGQLKYTKGKRKANLWALMVKRELSSRESGVDFLAVAALFGNLKSGKAFLAKSKAGVWIGKAFYSGGTNRSRMTFVWQGEGDDETQQSIVAAGMAKPKAQAEILGALRDSTDNINVYLQRKIPATLKQAGLQ